MPVLLNCLVYTEEDVLNNTEEKFEMVKPNRDSKLDYINERNNDKAMLVMEISRIEVLVKTGHPIPMTRRLNREHGLFEERLQCF